MEKQLDHFKNEVQSIKTKLNILFDRTKLLDHKALTQCNPTKFSSKESYVKSPRIGGDNKVGWAPTLNKVG